MRRRALFALVAAMIVAPPLAAAQRSDKVARIGYLTHSMATEDVGRPAFLKALRELGYVEGRNLQIEYRDADGKLDRLPALARELAALDVDVILTDGGTLGALAAKRATTTIPIVFPAVGDPVADGLVTSFARPGGNLTGFSLASQTFDKLIELLKQAVPAVTRVAVLLKPDAAPNRSIAEYRNAADSAARALGLHLQVVEARRPQDLDRAFAEMRSARADGLAVVATPVFNSARRRIAELALKHRLPAVFSVRDFAEAGGLMSYGAGRADLFRRAAVYVDKILKGAKPADLPIEQPTKFELVVNLKTAKALGVRIAPSLLSRADQVIDE